MKHNLLKSVIISVILLMGVSNAWGADWHLQNNPSHIYFCDATTKWAPNSSDHIIFLMGRDDTYGGEGVGSQAYDMIHLSNTNLWYYNVPKWGDDDNGRYQYIAFRHATSAWTDWKSETVTHRATWENSKYSMTRNDNISGKTLYYEPQSSTANTNTNVTGYLPKYTATVDFKVSRDGGSSYNVTNKKFGTITLKGTYMNGDAATGQSSATITGENNYNYNDIPVTGEFTLTNTTLTNDAYEFVGFGTGNTPTDKVNTKTWNITGNTNYYVFYKHKLYTVTYSKGTYGSGNNQTANKLHGETLALADKGAFTRTGYTQTAWNTNTDGKSGTSYALKANYTSNQAITLYPTWTANQYTINWNANGGSVTPTSSTYTYDGEPVALPTPTRTGYTFNGWFTASSGGTRISDVGETNKPASNTTYYAQWTENKYTVNIVANPAEAAKTLTLGSQQVGINDVSIATTTKIGYQFVNWTATDGITITNPNSANTTITATKAGTVTANFEARPSTTIYLEPRNEYWNKDDAKFVAHVWNAQNQIADIPMSGVGDGPKYRYYTCEIPYGYTNVVFFRQDPSGNTLWNKTADQDIPEGNRVLYTITDPGKGESNGYTPAASGEWKVADLVYTINLIGTQYGSYTVQYNEDQIYTIGEENKIIDIPANTQLTITNITPDEGYDKTIRYKRDGDIYRQFSQTENITYIVNSDLLIEEDFRVATEGNILYIKVDGYETFKYWCAENNDYGPQIKFINDDEQSAIVSYNSMIETSQYNLYEYIIPSGYHSFYIYPHGSTNASQLFDHEIIRSDYRNCYELKDNNTTASTGEWIGATVTLGYTDIGRFGVEYNGEVIYEDKAKQEDGLRDAAVIEVPFGAEIKVLAGEPGNDAFVNSMLYIDETGKKTKLDFTEQITSHTFKVRGDVTVDDLFGTKQKYIIYIGIPKNEEGTIREEFKDWDLACQQHDKGDQMYIWCHWPYDGFGLSGDEYYGSQALIRQIDVINTDEKYLFYKYELPKGIYTFNFQCKEYKDENNASPEHAASIFHYNPPLTTADCFILTGDKNDGKYAGYWTAMPSDGDFRILYVEQIVTKKEKVGDEWITEVKRTYEHSSDFIKPSELNTKGQKIVSLHIYTRGNNPEIILQKYDGTQKKWIDIEAHMVNGPLETDDPGMGLLPGRKNATPGSNIDDFVYDDGIEKIKNDPTDDGCGVWNFTVYKNGESAKLNLISDDGLKRYEGKYYIRTDNAEGQWINYKNPTNYMTFSPYAKQHHGEYFSHYFCKWVDTKQHYRDVSFIVANDYAQSLTDPSYLFEDQYVDNQWLPGSTNIRWGWSIINNKVSRAYIAGSYNGQNEFLVVHGQDEKVTLQANINGFNGYFNDNTNWLYYADLLARPQAHVQVTATYNTKDQYFMGTSEQFQKLIGGDANDERYYPIRILYDFKEHRFVVGYHPEEQIKGQDVAIETPVMLIREHHNAPNQISFDNTTRTIEAPMPAYGVITFLEDKLKDPNISKNEKMFYWVSFPFDVRISHAFGLGEYGSHWVMEEYDGEARAEEGWNIYNTFWRYITDTATTLQAGKGYVLCLNYNKVINEAFLSDAAYEKISLYFPSIEEVDQSTIKKQNPEDIIIPTWTGRAPTKDHNWNLIGAISYANTGETTQQSNTKFLYEYQPRSDTYSPRASNGYTFNALHAYMVQYGGKITWNNFIAPQSIAAKRDAENDDNMHELSLDLILNGTTQDQTFIQLEDGEATQMFDLNIDMTKIINSGSNIYSFSTDNNKLAGSVIPIEEAIIPLGVVSAAAGEYTFAMPEGTDGIVVELIDYETNTRTNMLLDNYTINLGKGTFDNRFALHVKPDKTTTSVDNIGNEATGDKVKKYLIDGVLYMQKDGVLYDAQGKLVR